EGLDVGEVATPGVADRRTHGGDPARAGEEAEGGQARCPRPRHWDVGIDAYVVRHAPADGHHRRRPATELDVALAGELGVRADDDPARYPEVGCERAGRR